MSDYDAERRAWVGAMNKKPISFLDKQAAKEKEVKQEELEEAHQRYVSWLDSHGEKLKGYEVQKGDPSWPEQEKIDDDVSIGEPCKELAEAVDKAVAYKDMMELREEVKDPIHYQAFGTDVMEVISRSMTEEAFRGFCLGNWLKYKLRAGNKGSADKDIAKSENYKVMFEEYKDYCIPTQPF